MSVDLLAFDFETAPVRVIELDGLTYFVGADVARVLGYRNPQGAVRRHCKGVRETLTPSEGGEQMTAVIPEGDVYRLVIRSKLPAAQRFEAWVMGVVLPTLRRTGQFTVKAKALDLIATAKGSFAITDAAKVLQVPPKKLFAYLYTNGWIYRRPNGRAWLGYSARAKQGLLEHKVFEHDGPDGNPRVREQCRITAKGLAQLAEAFATHSTRVAA